MSKILVTDGRSLASLAIIRTLGEKGFEIHCGEDFKGSVSSFSKYVKKSFVYPSAQNQPNEFVDFLLNLTKKEKYSMIIPVRDETTLLLSKNKSEFLEYTNLYLADFDVISKFRDKGDTVKLANKYGIPVPETYFPEDTCIQEIKNSVKYPVLIRARISSGSRGIKYVNFPSEFEDAYQEIKSEYGEPMIQEYISHDGGHYSIGTLFDNNSEPIAIHVYKETKQYPINGGPAVNAITVKKEQWVDDILQILKTVGWIGPAHMDVLFDTSSNTYRLLEVNPRFWMSLNLSIKSGVDIPYLLYQLSAGQNISKINSYKVGFKYRWVFPYEILWLMKYPNKIHGIKDLFKFWEKNVCDGNLSIRDPLPLIGVLVQIATFMFNSEKRKFIFKRGWSVKESIR